MRFLTLFMVLFAALFLNSQQSDAAPTLDGGERNYTLVFARDGEVSKGDICEDEHATIIGKNQTVVSTGRRGVQVLQGAVLIKSEKEPIKLAFGNIIGSLAENSKLLIERRGSLFDLLPVEGNATITIREQEQNLENNRTQSLNIAEPITLAPCTRNIDATFANKPSKEEPVRLLASGGTEFNFKDDVFSIMKGTAFVQLPARVSLLTPGGTITSAKPYMVSYRMVDNCLCVENVTPCDHIKFDVRGEEIKLQPYSGCVLKHCDAKTACCPKDGILRRNLLVKSDGVFTAMIAEYDPLSLVEAHAELKRTMREPVTHHDRRMSQLLFKGIAVFQELAGDLDSFQDDLKPYGTQMLGYFKNPLKFAAKYEILK